MDQLIDNNSKLGRLTKESTAERPIFAIFTNVHMFVINFSRTSSIHGFVYLLNRGLHFTERLLWAICICTAIYGTASLAQRTWNRFQTSPMVISMDRDKFSWNTTFPSLTVCPHKRIDGARVDDYIKMYPHKFPTDEDKEDFHYFMDVVSTVTYENLHDLNRLRNKTFGISGEEYLDLIHNMSSTYKPEVSSGTVSKMYVQETVTEMGICFSTNSKISVYNDYSYWRKNRWDLIKPNETVFVHQLDGEIYAQLINLSSAYEVYFHGATEVPDISRQRYSFGALDYTTVELLGLEIITSDNAKDLTVSQRQCRFSHESEIMQTSPIYSFNLCHRECRMRLAMRTCNCFPHFYRNRGRRGEKLGNVCDIQGLLCLMTIKDELITLKSKKININCKHCVANCDDSSFFVQDYRSRQWFLGANLQWGISNYPKMQLKRDLIFGFTDLLVYIGGMLGLFLGISLLSITECIYFFTWRITKHFYNKKQIIL